MQALEPEKMQNFSIQTAAKHVRKHKTCSLRKTETVLLYVKGFNSEIRLNFVISHTCFWFTLIKCSCSLTCLVAVCMGKFCWFFGSSACTVEVTHLECFIEKTE